MLVYFAVANLRGARGTPPRGPKFFQFHAVFGKIWENRMLPPRGVGAPSSGKSWIRHCFGLGFKIFEGQLSFLWGYG